MIQVIVTSDYKLKENEVVVRTINAGILANTAFDKGKIHVIFAEEHGLTQKLLVTIANNATSEIRVITNENTLVKGLRNKNIKVFDALKSKDESPFELAAMIINADNRQKLFDYLNAKKPNLLVPMRSLISNYHKLNTHNQKVLSNVADHFWKINPEVIHGILCFELQPQDIQYLKWNYPKKEKEKEK